MATYKAEFLSHYYAGRLRPRSAYAFGLIFYWARLAAVMPGVANFFTQTPLLRDVAKAVAGIAPERRIPPFAPETFTAWFRRRTENRTTKNKEQNREPPRGYPTENREPTNDATRNTQHAAHTTDNRQRTMDNGQRVILWPDTFNNHFHPETARAAVEVLEAVGCEVVIPDRWLCCGRPLYDYGMLDQAKKMLKDIIDTLQAEIRAGTPIVGLEPSCVAVFRDELTNLFPHDQDAYRLSKQVLTLSEFLDHKLDGFRPPQLHRKAIVHGHCHHKAIMKLDAEEALLQKIGLDFEQPDPGCCGMAGGFGFENGDHYDVSIKVGERNLLPAVRDADKETLIVADGFSCREQIAQTTDRRALHLAQILQMALREGPAGAQGAYPERRYVGQDGETDETSRLCAIAIGVGALLAGGVVAWGLKRLRRR
jgi:Fe-S oxidoreductase